jgi:hypothetical protein
LSRDIESLTHVQEKLGELYQKLQDSLNADTPIVVVCGPAKCDDGLCDVCDQERKDECFYHERIVLKQCLRAENCLPALFEEDFDLVIASLEETILLREDEVEKVIVIPASEGSAAELAQFARDPKIRPKLVVLVPYQYHPWYSEKESFLTSLYMEIMGVVGHIYPYDRTGDKHPKASEIVTTLMRSYRLNKLASTM